MKPIRTIACSIAILAVSGAAFAGQAVEARPGAGVSVMAKNGDGPERIGPRQQIGSRKLYLQSTNRWSEMMLKDDAVFLQLTDFGMQQVSQPQESREKDEGIFGNMVKAMALSGVKQLLDHSLALPLTEMRSARVRDGEVVLLTCKGKEVFNNVKINDQVQKFPQDQAEVFVSNLNRVRERLPACASRGGAQ